MAALGTISATFLAAGVSANNRLYTPDVIEKAVSRMQDRLADPAALPITMLSHHGAKDDSKEIVGRITSVSLDPGTNEAVMNGYLINNRAGQDIAAALDAGPDGRRTLDSVSIRGWWLGPVRTVDYEGHPVETGTDLEIDGVDLTRSPGLSAARIASANRLATESDARTPITESVEVQVMTDRPVVYSTSTPTTEATPTEASPTEEEAAPTEEAAAPDETPAVDETRAWLDETRAEIREAMVRVSGWQGPVDLDLGAYGLDNDDVAAAMTQIGLAYTAALTVLDPDNDNDLDLPGEPDDDSGGADAGEPCSSCGMALPDGASYCPACGAAVAETDEKENTVSDTNGAPATGPAADEAADADKGTAATETATTETATVAEDDTTPDATTAAPAPTPAAPAQMTDADREAIASLLHSKLTAAAPTESAPVKPLTEAEIAEKIQTETDKRVAAATEALRADMLEAYGTPRRKGLVEAAKGADGEKALHDMDPTEFQRYAAKAWDAVFTADA